jgi:cytochrome c5
MPRRTTPIFCLRFSRGPQALLYFAGGVLVTFVAPPTLCDEGGSMSKVVRGVVAGVLLASAGLGCGDNQRSIDLSWNDPSLIDEGRDVFRYETFGDEAYWTGVLHLEQVIADVLDPRMALTIGLKVDADALPDGLIQTADLESMATTIALLKMDAVIGLKGTVVTGEDGVDKLTAVGVTCALCHSTVDDSTAPGIGHRLDGWPNRDLDPGAIIALSPALTTDQKVVYSSWGRGRFDPRYNQDGFNGPVLIPPAYGLRNAPLATYTGDGDIRYWNDYVAVTQMGGQGAFRDDRLGIDHQLPPGTPELVEPTLEPLRSYQFSLQAPVAPDGSFDADAAARGRDVFEARCVRCHAPDDGYSGLALYSPRETGMDPTHADRSATKAYRATPLRGLQHHAPYFHDGSAPTLEAVVDRYDAVLDLALPNAEKAELVEFLRTL